MCEHTESTVLDPTIPSPSQIPVRTGAATDGRVQLPEREEIILKPCKGFPRRLIIDWGPSRASVYLHARNHDCLAEARVKHVEISLMAHDITTPRTRKIVYCLYMGEASFRVSPREFETLAAKLEPRGVKVTRS
jgi:hypothetical protein